MKTKNAMQLKAMIKKFSIEKNISPQLAMQNYMLERILARIAESSYRDNFVIKGGFLIGTMIGIDHRTTMDLDTTIKGFSLNSDELQEILSEICVLDVGDDMKFVIEGITEIREGDDYPGLRASLKANYEKMSVPLTIDITTGDVITPAAVITEISTMFDNERVRVYSYPLETIIAEKLETILSRSEANTRPRDYYDIYMLYKTRKNEIDRKVLKLAVDRTAKKRHSEIAFANSDNIIRTIENSVFLKENWNRYCKSNPYATGIEYKEVCATLSAVMEFVK